VQTFKSKYTDYILFPTLVLFTISLSLPVAFSSIFIIGLFVVGLGNIREIKTNIALYFSSKRNILLLVIFFCLLFSVLYSDDKKNAMKGILAAVTFLALPFSLVGIRQLSPKQIIVLKKLFVFSCLVISMFYFIKTGIRIGLFDGSYKFKPVSTAYQSHYLVYNLTYRQLTPSIHAVFFSLYLAVAVLIIIFEFEHKTRLSKILHGLLILYFTIYLILLTSVTINFALYSFIIAMVFFRYSFKRLPHYLLFFGLVIIGTSITDYLLVVKSIGPDIGDIVYKFDSPSINQKIIFSFITVILVSIVAIIVKLIPQKKYKLVLGGTFIIATLAGVIYFNNTKDSQNNNDQKINNISVRVRYNKEAIRIIKKYPLFGVGIGDKKFNLLKRDTSLGDKRYVEFGNETLPGHMFNPHNQFLDFWIAAGILPVICFLLFLINEFSKAIRYKHIVYLGLVYCFCLFCFTDMAMMVQRGQIFFLFFICLFEIESRKGMTASSTL